MTIHDFFNIPIPVIGLKYKDLFTILFTTLFLYFMNLLGKKKDDKEIREEVEHTVNKIINVANEQKDDVFTLMIKNVAELREYYVINKQQARRSFNAALLICILGFFVFISGISISYTQQNEIIKLSTISGCIIEIIAGLFFWLYKKAIDQINIFHVSLLKTEKFLTAIQLVEKISENRRDENYSFIVKSIIGSDILDKEPVVSSAKKKLSKPDGQ